MKTALISFLVALSLCASVAYAWVYKTREDFAAQSRAQQVELERIRAEAEARIAAEVALREKLRMALPPLQETAPVAPVNPISKDAAWSKWYQPPEQCGMNVAEADFVYCVNHKMLARKEFERAWLNGVRLD